ncbi:MAG: CCA tRNA nucleotidyltransferase [Candidatus Thermoplasmatota archaeon]|nr:CCA tRNA nucleotidyltransferase [Candidatus Thermoplasmatota archaeon]MDI6855721.1 CCA tRNA nucleotidyltransferase [Candidatus Thermoplasmatota archaeon]
MIALELEVFKRIAPTNRERAEIASVVNDLLKRACEAIKKLSVEADPTIVGSVAKDTWLKNPDIDIFILFPKHIERKKLEELGLKIGKEVLPEGVLKYAEHPYTSGFYKGYEIDVVPCYKIEKGAERISAVDRTPLHTDYIIENLKDEQKKEVRLLKQFLKGIGCYGAEARVEGFSGYLCELLIIKYGSFRNLIKEAQQWRRGKKIELVRSNAKFDSPLVVTDPVDPKRNVASAVSSEKFSIFIHACKEYLKAPKLEFFFPKKRKILMRKELLKELKERGAKILGIEFDKPDIIPDNLYPQLRKCEQAILQLCKEQGFEILSSEFYVNKSIVLMFQFEIFEFPSAKKHFGPYLWDENSKKFLAKWLNSKKALTKPYIENDRWVVDIKRDFTNAKALIKSKILSFNLGKDITEIIMKRGCRIIENESLANKKYCKYLSEFLDKRFSWEY